MLSPSLVDNLLTLERARDHCKVVACPFFVREQEEQIPSLLILSMYYSKHYPLENLIFYGKVVI